MARTLIAALSQQTIPPKRGNINSHTYQSAEQKRKDSMQPSTELAAIFNVPPLPTIKRVKG